MLISYFSFAVDDLEWPNVSRCKHPFHLKSRSASHGATVHDAPITVERHRSFLDGWPRLENCVPFHLLKSWPQHEPTVRRDLVHCTPPPPPWTVPVNSVHRAVDRFHRISFRKIIHWLILYQPFLQIGPRVSF
jgi:hypothetical protein